MLIKFQGAGKIRPDAKTCLTHEWLADLAGPWTCQVNDCGRQNEEIDKKCQACGAFEPYRQAFIDFVNRLA